MRKLISLLLVLIMVGSLAACGNAKQEETKQSSTEKESTAVSASDKESETASTEEVKEPVTITLYPANANITSGTVGGWVGDFFLENGYIVDVWSYSQEKLNAIMASGDFPDVMYMADKTSIKELGQNGALLDFDDYADKLPNLMNNEQMQIAMGYVKEYVTGGSLFCLPTGVGMSSTGVNTGSNAIKLNWPVYEEIGAPEFSSLEELIPILKQMKEVHPKTADGIETYGMHLYTSTGFDPLYTVFNVTGYGTSYISYGLELDHFDEEYGYILDDDSMFKYTIAFMNKLYREGLLDPDSMTTERTAQHQKIESGAALAGWAPVPGWEYSGYYPVWYDEMEIFHNLEGSPYGGSNFICVNAKGENVDAAIDFLNFLAEPETQRTLISGPKGELWDVDASGNVYVTEKGMSWWVDGTPAVLANGDTFALFNTPLFWGAADLRVDGQYIAANFADDVLAAKADNEINQMWQKTTGYENFMKMNVEKGTVLTKSLFSDVGKFAAAASDEQKVVTAATKTALNTAMWKMIYAESDAQFEQIWDEVVAECEGLGIKDLYEWRVATLKEGLEKKAALEK